MICVTQVGRAEGSREAAAALACAGAEPDRPALLVELSDGRAPRPTLVASAAARRLEERLVAHMPEARVASRGQCCHLSLPADGAGIGMLGAAAAVGRDLASVLHLPPHLLQPVLDEPRLVVTAALLRADLAEDRALTALAARDLIGRGLRVAVLKQPLGWVAARQALFGVLGKGGAGLPVRLVERLLPCPSHPCYAEQDATRIDTARASEQQRRDHAGTGSR
jgi:hypothetical protein